MKKIEFFWEGVPPKSTFQQRDRNFHKTPAARLAMAQWQAVLEQHVPEMPMKGPIALRIIVTWPHTAETRKRSRGGGPVYKTTRPDGDNILKGIKDIMTRLGYWTDDAQVSIEAMTRCHGDISGAFVSVKEIEDEPY